MIRGLSANGARTVLAAQVAASIAITTIEKTSWRARGQLRSKAANDEALRSGGAFPKPHFYPKSTLVTRRNEGST